MKMKIMNSIVAHRGMSVPVGKAQKEPSSRVDVAQALDSDALFAGSSEVVITHGTEIYRLRRTRQNRLILTK